MADWELTHDAHPPVGAHPRYAEKAPRPREYAPSREGEPVEMEGETWQQPPLYDHVPRRDGPSKALIPATHPNRHRVLLQAATAPPAGSMTVMINVFGEEGAKEAIKRLPDLIQSQHSAHGRQGVLVPRGVIAPGPRGAFAGGHGSVHQWPRAPSPPWMRQGAGKRKHDEQQGEYGDGKRRRAEVIEVIDDDDETVTEEAPQNAEHEGAKPPPAEDHLPVTLDDWPPTEDARRRTALKRSESEDAQRQAEHDYMYARQVHSEPAAEAPPPPAANVFHARTAPSTPAYDRDVSYAPLPDTTEYQAQPAPSPRLTQYTPRPQQNIRGYEAPASPSLRRQAPQGFQQPRPESRIRRQPNRYPGQRPGGHIRSSSAAGVRSNANSGGQRIPEAQVRNGRLMPPARFATPVTPGAFTRPLPSAGPSRAAMRNMPPPPNREFVNECQLGRSGSSMGRPFGLGPVDDWTNAGAGSGSG